MANEEHVALLRQGVETWNGWRSANRDVDPDLSGARLSDAILIYVDLSGVDLSDADLSGVDLSDADLSHADLIGANLNGADLIGANLNGADLIGANLNGADLSHAILVGTSIVNVDLSTVKGLDHVVHLGPSSIGIDTIYQSNANIPASFLRGAGVPETFIEYMHSLVVKPIDFYSVFISYSSHDEELAERLHADLQAARVRCWYAPHDLKPGEVIVSGIDQAIRLHEKVLLLLSEASVSSNWVSHEVQLALTREAREGHAVLFPVRLDDSVIDTASSWAVTLREARHIGDFRQWKQHDAYKAAFQSLLRNLTKEDKKADSKE